jgi:bifunctional enzyme CysN/CysC
MGRPTYVLDGDELRLGLNADLSFSPADRHENVRRAAHVAALLADAGLVVVVALISPYGADRRRAREIHAAAGLRFIEGFVDTPVAECERRDPKGLYARARRGELQGLTGIDAPYEPPACAELVLRTAEEPVTEIVARVLSALSGTTAPELDPRLPA